MHKVRILGFTILVFTMGLWLFSRQSVQAKITQSSNTSYYRGTSSGKNTTKIRHQQRQDIPKQFRGVYYSYNYLRNRKERIIVKKRDYHFSHQNSQGKWARYQRFVGKYLAVSKLSHDRVQLRYIDHRTKKRSYYAKDSAILWRHKKQLKLRVVPYRKNFISHRKTLIFKPRSYVIKTHPQKITRQWLADSKFMTCYFMYQDSQYNFIVSKNGKTLLFDSKSYWDYNPKPVYDDLQQSGKVQLIDFIPDKSDSSKANLVLGNPFWENGRDKGDYYSYYVQRISKNYLQGLKGSMKYYKGHELNRMDALIGKRAFKVKKGDN